MSWSNIVNVCTQSASINSVIQTLCIIGQCGYTSPVRLACRSQQPTRVVYFSGQRSIHGDQKSNLAKPPSTAAVNQRSEVQLESPFPVQSSLWVRRNSEGPKFNWSHPLRSSLTSRCPTKSRRVYLLFGIGRAGYFGQISRLQSFPNPSNHCFFQIFSMQKIIARSPTVREQSSVFSKALRFYA